MFVSPSKIKQNKLLKSRTISFETADKAHGNMVIIPTLSKEAEQAVISSTLFRPMQLFALYTPRTIKPAGRQLVRIDQKDYYADMRTATNGRIRRGKTMISGYGEQNLIYDIYNEYRVLSNSLKERGYTKLRLQNSVYESFENIIDKAAHDPDYPNVYLVFPITEPFDNPQRIFVSGTDFETIDPLALFVRAINNNKINKDVFENVKKVFFYVPKGDVLLAVDIHDPDFQKQWPNTLLKLKRLNNFAAGTDTLSDELISDDSDMSPEDKFENKKEDIKQLVLSHIAREIRAKTLTDYEAASREEQDLMVQIDKKIDQYLTAPENLKKTLDDMVGEIETDNDVKAKAVKYVETKKASIIKSEKLAKGLEKETEIIGSLQDLDDDSKENVATKFDIDVPYSDDRIKQSHLDSIDEEYNKKQMMTDISNCVSSFSGTQFSPMTVESFSYEDTSTDQDEKNTMYVRYKTDEGNQVSFQLDVPKIIDKRYLYLSGNKKVIKKQLIRLPIVKTKSNRVEITTNYNKMTIERLSGKLSRKNAYLLKKLKLYSENPAFQIEYGDNSVVNSKIGYENDFDYEELASSINFIKTAKYHIIFNRDTMRDEIDILDVPDDFVNPGMTPLGLQIHGESTSDIIYIKDGLVYRYNIGDKKVIDEDNKKLFEFLVDDVLKMDMSNLPSIGKSFVYTKVKFLAASYPVFVVVASQVGLTNTLDRYNVEYHKSIKQEKKNVDYVEVKFKDCYLYYKDSARVSLLLNALYLMHTEDFNYSDFDIDIPYTRFFMETLGDSIGIHVRNMLRINLAVVIDPITRDILRDLKLPTNIIDLLLYANTLLVGNQYKLLNDMTNYRVRSNELVAAVMYGLLADAYVNYCRHKINGRPINMVVPKGALISSLLQQPNINDKSTLNPIIECEQIAQASAKGYRGVNINDAYTLEMRVYSDSMNGVISGNATPYSGQAGITRSLSYDPKIYSVRGYIPANDGSPISGANMLSPTELLGSFTAAFADPPRQAMQVAQTGHTMPILHSSKQLIGSGMNKTLAFMISDDFAFKAKEDGYVEKIDDKNKVALLQYDNDTRDAIDLADKLDKNSNMGFYIHQNFKMVYREGEHFKKGDVLAYNPSYFSGKGKNVDYQPGSLAKIAIADGDFSYEDSTIISESLAERCASKINMLKQVVLGKNATIYKLIKKGDTVHTGDHLLEFMSSFDDEDTSEMLQKLQDTHDEEELKQITHETVDSKYSGTITDVEIFYNCQFEELSPSLQEIIKEYKQSLSDRAKAVEGITTGSVHVPPLKQVNSKKIGKAEFSPDGGVIINIYIEYIDVLGMGDKITYSTALKGVVSRVLSKDESPISDSKFSCNY